MPDARGSLETVSCALCGADDAREYLASRDRAFPAEEVWHVVRCKRCGLFYLNPRPNEEAIAAYYPEDYSCFTAAPSDLPAFSATAWKRRIKEITLEVHFGYGDWGRLPGWLRPAAWLLTLPMAAHFGHILPAQGERRVLDVGCGIGAQLSVQAKFGWKTWGVDPSPQAVEIVRAGGHDVSLGKIEDAGYPDAFFDAVLFHHSLEHIHDPRRALRMGDDLRVWARKPAEPEG
jgi:SAM-dependent methyltransferase